MMFLHGFLMGLVFACVVVRVAGWDVRRRWLTSTRENAARLGIAYTEGDSSEAIWQRIHAYQIQQQATILVARIAADAEDSPSLARVRVGLRPGARIGSA
jgi:hypothetical protein